MRGTVAKRLRRKAESETVGKHKSVTRKVYRLSKKQYKTETL